MQRKLWYRVYLVDIDKYIRVYIRIIIRRLWSCREIEKEKRKRGKGEAEVRKRRRECTRSACLGKGEIGGGQNLSPKQTRYSGDRPGQKNYNYNNPHLTLEIIVYTAVNVTSSISNDLTMFMY